MRKVLMLATVATLSVFTLGCAQQKKVVDVDSKGNPTLNAGTSTTGVGNDINGAGNSQIVTNGVGGTGWSDVGSEYNNVDPYGTANYGDTNYGDGNYNSSNGNNYGRDNNYANGGSYNQNNNYNSNGSSHGMKNIYFGVDQYVISANKLSIIIGNANILKKNHQRVRIEGHCDASGTDEYNYALGLKRAKSAKEALVNRGVDASSITIVSMGESAPECTGYSRECFAKNRRVEFK